MWLSSRKPKDAKEVPTSGTVAEVDSKETFNWEPETGVPPSVVSTTVEQAAVAVAEVEKINTPVDTLTMKQNPVAEDEVTTSPVQKDSTFTIEIKETIHVVQAGETLYSIAHQHNLGVMDLVHWNDLNLQEGFW